MSACRSNMILRIESALGSLLHELQIIWDEIGESDDEKDQIMLELEQECSEVFRRKVDQATRCRAQLKQAIADAEAELAAICSSMGERPVHIRQSDQNPESLKAELRVILPQIEEMRRKKNDRKNKVLEVLFEVQSIKNEICSSDGFSSNEPASDEGDLSIKRLEELHKELHALQKEKSIHEKMTLDHLNSLNSLCIVLGLNFKKVVSRIHPSLDEAESSKNISNSTLEKLRTAIQQLRELKLQRMQQLQDLTTSLLELWNLMDTPIEEQKIFQKVTCKLAASEDEITEPNILSVDYINSVAAEVSRLEELKASKLKELVLKKEAELEDICKRTHLIPEINSAMETTMLAIDSGAIDADCVLDQIELKIARVKEEALSRKEIIEKVEKWMAACEEESWLEIYNRDDSRYNAGRGAHLTLKRAEKARTLVNKLPAMVDTLASKILAWENDRGIEFIYDGVRLYTLLEGYKVQRKEKEQQRKRQREQKKHHTQLLTEQEALFGSKPSPIPNVKKAPRLSYVGGSNRRVSRVTPIAQDQVTPPAKATTNIRIAKKIECMNQNLHKDNRKVSLVTPIAQAQVTPPAKATTNIFTAKKDECINQNRRKDNRKVSLVTPIAQARVTHPAKATSNIFTAKKNENINQNRRKDDRHAPSYSVQRRGLSMVGPTVKQHSPSARESELSMKRKPFSPIPVSPATPPKSNTANTMEDLDKKHNELWQKLLTINSTPPRALSRTEQENRTSQKTMTGVTSTPSTVSIRTRTAITPTSIQTMSVEEEIECSFEEMRARCVQFRSPLVNVAQVYKL